MDGEPTNAPVLTELEAQSALWKKIKAHVEARIGALREMNDNFSLDERRTARLRGQLRELKNLAALDQPAPQTEADDVFKD